MTRQAGPKDPTRDYEAACPCGSGRGLAHCCGAFHAAQAQGRVDAMAPDAERLMRSRYSAYVLDRLDYLRATWHPDRCPATLSPNEPGLRWLGLSVRAHRPIDSEHAEVEFVARYKLGGRAHRLAERSRFVRLDGRWLYADGDAL